MRSNIFIGLLLLAICRNKLKSGAAYLQFHCISRLTAAQFTAGLVLLDSEAAQSKKFGYKKPPTVRLVLPKRTS